MEFSFPDFLSNSESHGHVVLSACAGLSPDGGALESEGHIIEWQWVEGSTEKHETMLFLFLLMKKAPQLLRPSLFDDWVGIDSSEGDEGITVKEAHFDGSTKSFVETVDGEGECFSCDFVLDDGRKVFGGEMLIGNSEFEISLLCFFLTVDDYSENGDFEDADRTFFTFKKL